MIITKALLHNWHYKINYMLTISNESYSLFSPKKIYRNNEKSLRIISRLAHHATENKLWKTYTNKPSHFHTLANPITGNFLEQENWNLRKKPRRCSVLQNGSPLISIPNYAPFQMTVPCLYPSHFVLGW